MECVWCHEPVPEESAVILKKRQKDGSILELPLHWECFAEARETLAAKRKNEGNETDGQTEQE